MEFLHKVPVWVWIGGAALLAYMYFSRKSSSAQTPANKTTGGGGSIKTGNTIVKKGAVHVTVMQDGHGKDQDQPGPTPSDTDKQIVVPKDETLGQLAKYLHWSKNTLDQVEELNATGGQEWTEKTKLRKGQTVLRPVEGQF